MFDLGYEKNTFSVNCYMVIHADCLRPKVGLVLSGGGAKGLTHIGIIRALEENNIPIDYITGTSMGPLSALFMRWGILLMIWKNY